MSKNIKTLLAALNIENADAIEAALLADEESAETIQAVLKASQAYSKPFIETELNANFNNERKTLKGKYYQTAARDANKEFGNKLTNKELEDIMADPANEGRAYQAVIAAIKGKTSDTGDNKQLQDMLDAANGKIGEYETKMTDMEAKHKADFDNYVKTGKLTTALETKLVSILQGITSMKADKAAQLLREPLMKKALVKLNDTDGIELFDPANPESKLKKSETEFQTLEGIVKELADEYELPKVESGGVHKVTQNNFTGNQYQQQANEQLYKNSALGAAEELAAAMM